MMNILRDRNTIVALKQEIDFLEEVAVSIEYGDTGSALKLIDDWQTELSELLTEVEDEMALFDEDSTSYYRRNISKTIEGIINHPL